MKGRMIACMSVSYTHLDVYKRQDSSSIIALASTTSVFYGNVGSFSLSLIHI